MTTIYYTDSLDQRISEDQLDDDYNKVFSENNVIQRIESYHHHVIEDITYFLSENEKIEIVLTELQQQAARFVILSRREQFGKNTIVKSTQFSAEKTLFNYQELFDENNQLICHQDLELITETPILLGTEKDLYDENGETIAHFDYDAEGNLRDLWGQIVYDANIYEHQGKAHPMETITGIEMINKHFPALIAENPYYSDATFLPNLS